MSDKEGFCSDCGSKLVSDFSINEVPALYCPKCDDTLLKKLWRQKKMGIRFGYSEAMNNSQPENLRSLAVFFTIVFLFIEFEISILVNSFLIQYFPEIHPAIYPNEIVVFINAVRPFGYICLIIVVILIILGFLIKKEKLVVSGSFLLFLPTFGSFATSMFFLAGIGILQALWLPLETPFFNFLTLGNIVFLPSFIIGLFAYINPLFPFLFLLLFQWVLLIIGLYLFTLGVISWFYGKHQKKDIINFSIYKHSRHPQYLGFLLWSYGISLQYWLSEFFISPFGHIGLKASLPWVISALIVVSVAFLEDIEMSKKYPEKYKIYRERTSFLIPLPKSLKSIVSFPIRFILRKNFPETKKEVLLVVTLYGVILIGLSLLFSLMFPQFL